MQETFARLLTTAQAAEFCGLTEAHMRRLRFTGDGPKFYKLGGKIAYDQELLVAWLQSRLRTSTRRGAATST